MKKELKQLNKAVDALREQGISVVYCVAKYKKNSARFHTRHSVTENKKAHVSEDHIAAIDMVREIVNNWSKCAHRRH